MHLVTNYGFICLKLKQTCYGTKFIFMPFLWCIRHLYNPMGVMNIARFQFYLDTGIIYRNYKSIF